MKKIISLLLALAMLLSLASCGGNGNDNTNDSDEPNTSTEQTEFTILGGQSALSPGYQDNTVLNQLQENVGISIEWHTMSDSLSEQVGVRIAGGQLPDAFMGVGFSNYDLANYGADGTFIDLTPYITEEIMPNLTKILEENPDIRAAITMADGKIYGLPAGEKMGTAGIGEEEDYSIYPVDCVFTQDELDVIDRYRADFESAVSEQEGLWIKEGGPTDEEWESYKQSLNDSCGMSKLLEVYQAAYDRYAAAE
jgi:putative aldouronate transport system substrate-binding protein